MSQKKAKDENLNAIELFVAYLNSKAKVQGLDIEFNAGTCGHDDFYEIYVECLNTRCRSSIYVCHADPNSPLSAVSWSDDMMTPLCSRLSGEKLRYREIVENLLKQKGHWCLIYDGFSNDCVGWKTFLLRELTSKSLPELILKLNVMIQA